MNKMRLVLSKSRQLGQWQSQDWNSRPTESLSKALYTAPCCAPQASTLQLSSLEIFEVQMPPMPGPFAVKFAGAL